MKIVGFFMPGLRPLSYFAASLCLKLHTSS
jgi:hypothetical protein